MVDEERAKSLVAAALGDRDPVSMKRACLTNKSYTEEAAAVLATALQDMTSLEDVDFSDMIAGRPEEVGLCVLRAVCGAVRGHALRHIDLSDNAMGEKGINACRAALEGQPGLRSLKLCNDGLSASAMEAVRDILLECVPTSLETLHFYNNMSGDGGAHALAAILPLCPRLRDLRFSGTRAGADGSMAVADALAGSPAARDGTLERLDLADNSFGAAGGRALAEALLLQPGLVSLNLRDGGLGTDGLGHILAGLARTAPGLTFLDVSGNDLDADAARPLARCLATKPALTTFLAEENEIGSKGALRLARGLAALPAIEVVNLSTNEITTSGATAIVKALAGKVSQHCPVAAAATAASVASLRSLELNGNGLSEKGLIHIARMLEAAGREDALGEMDDNDPDLEDEEADAEQEEEDEEDLRAAAVLLRGASGIIHVEEMSAGYVLPPSSAATAAAEEEATGGAEKPDEEVDELADELSGIKM
ncbi:unnamed protein product [Phaeothamnion confervicola]